MVRRRGRKEHYVRSGEIEISAAPHIWSILDTPTSETGLGVSRTDIIQTPPFDRPIGLCRVDMSVGGRLSVGQRPDPVNGRRIFHRKRMRQGYDGLSCFLGVVGKPEHVCGSSRSGTGNGNLGRVITYIRKTPNLVSPIGAFSAADRLNARTVRVSAGSMMPSSQRRAVA